MRVGKLVADREAPWRPVVEGAQRVAGAAHVDELCHASTVPTNAPLERRGGPIALLTTAGFEGVLQLGRQPRPALYALRPRLPPPLVDAALRFGVAERLAADGTLLLRPT